LPPRWARDRAEGKWNSCNCEETGIGAGLARRSSGSSDRGGLEMDGIGAEQAGAGRRRQDRAATAAYRIAVLAVLAYCALQVSLHIALAILPEGSNWQQGDWLINSRLVPVRRGLFGSGLIDLSDLTGVGLLNLTIGLQLVLMVLLLGLLAVLFLPVQDRLAHLLLLGSPGFVPLFWGNDPNGALRKEMVAFLALALMVLALRRRSLLLHGVSAALLALSFYGNEFCVLFAPLFIGATAVSTWQAERARAWLVACGFVAVAAGHALATAWLHARAAQPALICAPLLERGLAPYMCQGAIAYLGEGGAANAAQVRGYIASTGLLRLIPATALLVLAAPAYVVALCDRPGRLALCCLAAALPFVALYPVAVDWGRWISIQLFAAVVVILVGLDCGALRLTRAPLPALAALLLAIGLFVSPDHALRSIRSGVVPELAVDWRMLKGG